MHNATREAALRTLGASFLGLAVIDLIAAIWFVHQVSDYIAASMPILN